MTKEELIKQNAQLQTELRSVEKEYDAFGDTARRNLAKTLGISTQDSLRYGERVEKLPEWSEIYARIGALRTIEQQKHDAVRIENLERVVADIIKELGSEDA